MAESYELAMHLVGLNPDNEEDFDNSDAVDKLLYEKYGIQDTEGFDKLIKNLMELIDVGKSHLTEKAYKGFAKNGFWFCKVPVNESEWK